MNNIARILPGQWSKYCEICFSFNIDMKGKEVLKNVDNIMFNTIWLIRSNMK